MNHINFIKFYSLIDLFGIEFSHLFNLILKFMFFFGSCLLLQFEKGCIFLLNKTYEI